MDNLKMLADVCKNEIDKSELIKEMMLNDLRFIKQFMEKNNRHLFQRFTVSQLKNVCLYYGIKRFSKLSNNL
jgi:hypothetical protein